LDGTRNFAEKIQINVLRKEDLKENQSLFGNTTYFLDWLKGHFFVVDDYIFGKRL